MIAAVSLAKTPCPPWCWTNHDRYRSHGQRTLAVDNVVVWAFQYDDKPPNVSVCTGPPGRANTVEIAPEQAAAFAALLSDLGHPEIATAVREAAALMGVTW